MSVEMLFAFLGVAATLYSLVHILYYRVSKSHIYGLSAVALLVVFLVVVFASAVEAAHFTAELVVDYIGHSPDVTEERAIGFMSIPFMLGYLFGVAYFCYTVIPSSWKNPELPEEETRSGGESA